MTSRIIDAHQHFWDPVNGDYGWLSGPFEPIRRVFSPADLQPAMEENGVAATVLVQTWHDLNETRDFLTLAEQTDFVAGVVGWVDLTDPKVGEVLAALKAGPGGQWLVSVRHLLHEEPDPKWLLREDAQRGLRAVTDAGLAYDLVGKTVHLPAMIQTVANHPQLRFVLDHIAKPEIKQGVIQPWASLMTELASHRDHVWCKLSGMITEADWESWSPSDLRPYIAETVRLFGPERCMFGTDWPVCLVAGSYGRVIKALRANLDYLTEAQRDQIFGRSVIESYRLPSLRAG
jgi:L-fuconolactonase